MFSSRNLVMIKCYPIFAIRKYEKQKRKMDEFKTDLEILYSLEVDKRMGLGNKIDYVC